MTQSFETHTYYLASNHFLSQQILQIGTQSHENPSLHLSHFRNIIGDPFHSIEQNDRIHSSPLKYILPFYRVHQYKVYVFPCKDLFKSSRILACILFYRVHSRILFYKEESFLSLFSFLRSIGHVKKNLFLQQFLVALAHSLGRQSAGEVRAISPHQHCVTYRPCHIISEFHRR